MATVYDLIESLEKVNILEITGKAIRDASDLMAQLNREQLKIGMTSDDIMLPDYSKTSVLIFGKTPGPIKLYDKGNFYKSIKVDSDSDMFKEFYEFICNDPNNLQKRYKDFGDILGLTSKNKENISEKKITPFIIKEIENITGLKANL